MGRRGREKEGREMSKQVGEGDLLSLPPLRTLPTTKAVLDAEVTGDWSFGGSACTSKGPVANCVSSSEPLGLEASVLSHSHCWFQLLLLSKSRSFHLQCTSAY